MFHFRHVRSILATALLCAVAAAANAQAYTSIVVFGDSLSDTGNDTNLSQALYTINAAVPSPSTGYTYGRFTDGTDTSPAARSYNGVWVEQLAALLAAKPIIKNSLAGGTDYAYGYATTGTGTSVFAYGPNNALAFNVNNMQLQLSTYLATKPTITNKTLFVIWGGANDLLAATATNATQVVTAAVTNEATIVQTLIAAGATDFLVVNLPPLGLVPRNNGSPTTSVPATQLAQAYDQALAGAMSQIAASVKGINLFQLDTYTLFNTIVGPPIYKGFADVVDMSQGNTAINPDTYLFWDSLHPTTYGHSLLAAAALTSIGTPVVTTTAVTTSNSNANLNASVTFTASVATSSSTPMGTVTFYDGKTALGSSLVFGSSSTATATYTTTTLAAGTHSITAQFAGVNGYTSSTSAVVTETVTAPAFSANFATAFGVVSGQSISVNMALSAVGGYAGTVTFACGTLPAHFTCSIAPNSVTFPSSTNAALVTVGTSSGTAALVMPARPGSHIGDEIAAAVLFFPGFGFFAFLFGRRDPKTPKTGKTHRLLLLFALIVSLGTAAGLSGCGSSAPSPNPNFVPAGSYTIPIVYTANGTPTTVNLAVTVN